MSPTTDDRDKYDEEQRRRDWETAEMWSTVLTCGAWAVVVVFFVTLYMVLR